MKRAKKTDSMNRAVQGSLNVLLYTLSVVFAVAFAAAVYNSIV